MLTRAALLVFVPAALLAAEPSLQQRFERIQAHSRPHGSAGLSVLKESFNTMSRRDYRWVGLEDLWATALKEGRTLFTGSRPWGATLPGETGDMLGQTTVGPWQITIANAREYGAACGVEKSWDDNRVIAFLESQPAVQARISADFIEESYREYGRRTPLAMQRYFWLDGFLQKKIGQGAWYNSVLAKTAAGMAATGFYAKQLLLGSRFNPEGLLYWLYRTGDEDGVRETLAAWKEKGHEILPQDLDHCSCDTDFRIWLSSKIREKCSE